MKKLNQKVIDDTLKNIEQNLDTINVEQVIKYSGYSYFHFHRLFLAYVGESVKQYIKRLKLQRAAHELKYKNIPITQVALNAGFETPSSFNRAFKEFFDANPTDYKISTCKEYEMIEPIRVENIEPIKVYAVRHMGNYNKLGVAFDKLMKFIYTQKIKHKKELLGEDTYAYSIPYDDPEVVSEDKLRCDVCVSDTDDSIVLEDGIKRQTIEGGKYAVFLHKGAYENLGNTYSAIFSSYVKGKNISLRDVPVFEKYLNRDPRKTKPENLKTEIFIPIC